MSSIPISSGTIITGRAPGIQEDEPEKFYVITTDDYNFDGRGRYKYQRYNADFTKHNDPPFYLSKSYLELYPENYREIKFQ
jgi:hypothetical protein